MNITPHPDCDRLAKNIVLMRWAERAASEHHELEVIVPPEFDRIEALIALEQAVIRKYSMTPLIQIGQGRSSDGSIARSFELGLFIGVACCAIVAAAYGVARWLL